MKAIRVDSLPADPLEALRELSRADVELETLRCERVEAARGQGATWDSWMTRRFRDSPSPGH